MFPLRDYLDQAAVGGHVFAGILGDVAQLRAIRGTSHPLDRRHRRNVSLVASVNAGILAYRESGRPLALRFAPIRSLGSYHAIPKCALDC